VKRTIQFAAIVLATLTAGPAMADRLPTKSERDSISSTLRANGFVSWGKIELDDGRWEVDNARHRSGRVYDVDIKNGRIVRREREWD